ncbi:hypothetical protein NQZ68_000652 [Dissostichus eleginoides]|nr:hypothetical protein NQZ68_000652 [Dissostichus eleginoides]
MHQNFQTGRRPLARASTRGGGDAPAWLWALCPGRSRSWSRRASPGSPCLKLPGSPSVSSYTPHAALSVPHCALSIQVSPPPVGLSDAAASSSKEAPNYRCKSEPFFQVRVYLYPNRSSRELDPPCAPSPVRIQQRQLHQRPEPDTHDYPIPASSSYTSIHSHLCPTPPPHYFQQLRGVIRRSWWCLLTMFGSG